mgnify:CR=1 FL=1
MTIPIRMAADPTVLQQIKNVLGSDAFFKTVGKGLIGSKAFSNTDNSLGENIIDSMNAAHPALLFGNAASKKITGKNLREGFTDSGVTELDPAFFASQYLSY